MINLLYMCIMGPENTKKDIYNVMTNSRELANYCQESVMSLKNKKISESLNSFHLKTSIDFITNLLTEDNQSVAEFRQFDDNNRFDYENKTIYNKVIKYIERYFANFNSLIN